MIQFELYVSITKEVKKSSLEDQMDIMGPSVVKLIDALTGRYILTFVT